MNYASESVVINREVEAVEIPSGRHIIIYPGTEVRIMQTVGGSFTVTTHQGVMGSISGKDADALGKEIPEEIKKTELLLQNPNTEEAVWGLLKTCFDPEIPHNIVDLGLVYECRLEDLAPDQKKIFVKMTLTAPGCGMGEWLKQDVQSKLVRIHNVKEVEIQMVFDPPWNPSMMHPAIRRAMGLGL